ncbi:hypothetical protein [Tenacibaculum sp. SG-28]|uniref:hypothetical protein n=1 Tax=Tenacibaculum sp. SG-28 TaxID=754426 RepID=UPI000CF40A10|nr:hypothetical protein [Tenacibaculum sp. SG-28]PQJ22839.1 hypothetical protein BSU00_00590 [Tenacibaculum sp. SG-28]
MTRYLLVFLGSFLCACASENKNTKEFVYAEPSEMAVLMQQMFAKMQETKENVMHQKDIGPFPDYIKNIHSATLTNATFKSSDFRKLSDTYVQYMVKTYTGEKSQRKENFNTAVNSCVQCHEIFCRGPIPKIKKLWIN